MLRELIEVSLSERERFIGKMITDNDAILFFPNSHKPYQITRVQPESINPINFGEIMVQNRRLNLKALAAFPRYGEVALGVSHLNRVYRGIKDNPFELVHNSRSGIATYEGSFNEKEKSFSLYNVEIVPHNEYSGDGQFFQLWDFPENILKESTQYLKNPRNLPETLKIIASLILNEMR